MGAPDPAANQKWNPGKPGEPPAGSVLAHLLEARAVATGLRAQARSAPAIHASVVDLLAELDATLATIGYDLGETP